MSRSHETACQDITPALDPPEKRSQRQRGPAPTLVFTRPLAANGDLSIAARLIAARSILWPHMNPSISFLCRCFRMTDKTVIAAQRELAAFGFEYQWATGHPTRRDRTHRIVSLPPAADPAHSRYGIVGPRHAALLHGQKPASLLLGINSTGLLLDVDEAADVLRVSRRTAYRASQAVRAACVMRTGEGSSSALGWTKALEPTPLQEEAAKVFLGLSVLITEGHPISEAPRLSQPPFEERADAEPQLIPQPQRERAKGKCSGDGDSVSPRAAVHSERLPPMCVEG